MASTGVLCRKRQGLGLGRVLVFDIQGWITLVIGGLLALITLFSFYSHASIPFIGTVALDQQIGVLLLFALVPTLVGGVELATRRRLRAERDRVRKAQDRARAEDEAARRARLQARCTLVQLQHQLQHQLDPTPEHTRQLRGLIAFLLEYRPFA